MIIAAFFRSLAQMGDGRFLRVLALGVGLTLLLFMAIGAAFIWGIGVFVPDQITLPWIGTITWVNNIASLGGVVMMILLSLFLMVPTASAFTGIFLDRVADAVEARHYPDLPQAQPVPLSDALRDSLSFLGVMIVANLLALVLYLLFAPFAPLIFWGLNGYLLGREYFMMVAIRRLGRAEAGRMRARHWLTLWIAGFLMAWPLSIPVVNLLIPVLGAATFTHIYHALQERS